MKALVFGAAIAIVTAGVAWGSFGMEGELAANLKEKLTTSKAVRRLHATHLVSLGAWWQSADAPALLPVP